MMWSSVQCGPDPFKASLQAIHVQQSLAEQSRSSNSAVGHGSIPLSTASSRPLLHPQQLHRPHSSQQRASVSSWADEYQHAQQPSHNTPPHRLPLHSAPASSWLTEYSYFYPRQPVSAISSAAALSVDEYSRTLAQHPIASHAHPTASVSHAISHSHQPPPQPHLSTISQMPLPQIPATLTAFHQPFATATATFQSHSPQPTLHNVLPTSASSLPSSAPIASSTAHPSVAPLTSAHSANQASTTAASDAAYSALEAARLHDALYADEHELTDADFIHNGQWQHFTTQHHDSPNLTPATTGISTHILQQMTHPQHRYTAEAREGQVGSGVREGVVGVDVGELEFGSEWDASGRVWDWVVRERQSEEAADGQHVEKMYSTPAAVTTAEATAHAAGVGDMDVLLKEFYL